MTPSGTAAPIGATEWLGVVEGRRLLRPGRAGMEGLE